MTTREIIHQLIDDLPETELPVIMELLKARTTGKKKPITLSPEERRHKAYKLAGKYRTSHTPVEEFLREKHEETAREDARLKTRWGTHE
jgi:CBS domain-containing protein